MGLLSLPPSPNPARRAMRGLSGPGDGRLILSPRLGVTEADGAHAFSLFRKFFPLDNAKAHIDSVLKRFLLDSYLGQKMGAYIL